MGVRTVAVRCRPRSAIHAVGPEAAVGELRSGSTIVAVAICGIDARIRTNTTSLWLVAVRWVVAVRCRPRSAIRAVGAELAVNKLATRSAIVASTINGVAANIHANLSHRAAQLKDEQDAGFHHFSADEVCERVLTGASAIGRKLGRAFDLNCKFIKLHKQPGERDNPVPAKARPGLTSRGGRDNTTLI